LGGLLVRLEVAIIAGGLKARPYITETYRDVVSKRQHSCPFSPYLTKARLRYVRGS